MEQSPVELSKEGSLETAKTSAVRVLHVDDDAGFLRTAKTILEMRGAFQVDTASSVEEAAGKMKMDNYDVVVCDYQMPGKDGLQFLEELRKSGNGISFILFTGKGREEVAMRALNLGADRYFNKSGYPETVYGELAHGIRQVVDKRRAEQSFLKSEDKYRRLVETLREGVWVIDKDSCTTFVNPRMAEILGYNIEEMKGRDLFSFMDDCDVEIAKRLLERRWQGFKEQHDFEFLRKDGTRVYATLETAPITDDNGNYIGALASIMDVTERKKAEKEVQVQREELQMILDCLPLQIWYKDKDNRLVKVNKKFAEYMGVSKTDLEGKPLGDLFPQDIALKCWKEDKEVIETGQPNIDILDYHESAQGLRWFLTSKVPCKYTDGKITGTINFSFDITERKKAEENLEESEERYRQLIEFAPDPIFTYDLSGRLLDCNRQAEKLSGFKREELLGKEILTSTRGRNLTRIVPGKRTEPAEYELVSRDGSKFDLEISTFPVNRKGKVEIIAIGRDMTERKKAEEALN